MNTPKVSEAVPLIATTLGGMVIGAFATNGFTTLGWELEWETLVAGVLGLIGGWLAYKAATDHRRVTENRNAYIFKARHLRDLFTVRDLLESHQPLACGQKVATVPRLDTKGIIEKLNNAACFSEPLPTSLTNELEGLCEALPLFELAAKGVQWTMKSDSATTVTIDDPESMALSFASLQGAVDKLIVHLLLDETRK